MAKGTKPGRTRVERGIYRQPNGKLAVCARHAGRLHFPTCGGNLVTARRARKVPPSVVGPLGHVRLPIRRCADDLGRTPTAT
jgi:hypothetical protein